MAFTHNQKIFFAGRKTAGGINFSCAIAATAKQEEPRSPFVFFWVPEEVMISPTFKNFKIPPFQLKFLFPYRM